MKKLIIITALTFFSFATYANDCFNTIDSNASGSINGEEYAILVGILIGEGVDPRDIPSFAEVDSGGNGLISVKEFEVAFTCTP